MSKTKGVLQPGLFDEPAAPATFRHVPHALFLAWPAKAQLRYCKARDLDSAQQAENATWKAFYLERASHYQQELERG